MSMLHWNQGSTLTLTRGWMATTLIMSVRLSCKVSCCTSTRAATTDRKRHTPVTSTLVQCVRLFRVCTER